MSFEQWTDQKKLGWLAVRIDELDYYIAQLTELEDKLTQLYEQLVGHEVRE